MDAQLDYPLTANSVVVEVGGYRGEWASQIAKLYDPIIVIYEPVLEYVHALGERFRNNGKVVIFHAGLGAKEGPAVISKMEEASSFFLDAHTVADEKFRHLTETENTWLFDAGEGFPRPIDLLSLNCEGAEFLILPRLMESGRIKNFTYVQIQFHRFMKNAEVDRDLIRAGLLETHDESWCVPWGWESWRRR